MPGWLAFAGLLGVTITALGGLLAEAPGLEILQVLADGELLRIVRNTLWQAFLSTLISILLAIPFARALVRRTDFPGRQLLISLSSISLVIPTMVAVLGIAAVHGRNGWLNHALEKLGMNEPYSVYGLGGILLAHVFFNLPLATRVILGTLESLPGETWRLAAHLGLGPSQLFRHQVLHGRVENHRVFFKF